MTSTLAGLASIALILSGLACLTIGPAIAVVLRWFFGVMFALAALCLILIIVAMSLLNHVATVSGVSHAPATSEVWTAALLGGGVLTLALWRGRGAAPLNFARRLTPRALANMARADTPRPLCVAPLPVAPAALRLAHRPAPRLAPASPRPAQASPVVNDAILALVGLGFNKADAAASVASAVIALGPQASLPALIKAALRRAA